MIVRPTEYNNDVDKGNRQYACPILSIYFLGHWLENIHIPVTRVERKYYDNATGEELSIQEVFIETLTHNSFVIQIPELRKRRNMDVEDEIIEGLGNLERIIAIREKTIEDKDKIIVELQRQLADREDGK